MGQKKLLLFTPNMIHEVRKQFGLEGPGRMEEAIDLLEEWVKKQRHFTKHDIPRNYLETTLITCKGSMERSKAMLDKICTMRTLVPEFFGEYHVNKDFPGLRDYFVTVLLPKPTPDLCRVYVCKVYDTSSMKKHAMNALRYLTILADFAKLNDYLGKAVVIVDLMDANLSDLISGIDVVDIKRHSSIIMDGFGMRPQKVYVLTASKLVCTLMTLMKSAVKQKVAARMEVVKSCEELQKRLPRDLLPLDYGGQEDSIRDLQDLWLDALSSQDFLEYLREMNTAKTNEAMRLRADFNENYAGMPGTFKYLRVD